MSIKFNILAVSASLAMASTAMATTTTIISDTFPSTQGIGSGSYLAGSSPNVGPTGSTWVTNLDGGAISSTSSYQPFIGPPPDTANPATSVAIFPNAVTGDVAAAIGFTPTGNGILSLTATLDWEGGSWLGMGFANAASTANPSGSPGQSGPWMLITSSVQMFGGTGSTGNFVVQGVNTRLNTVTFTYNPATMMETLDVSNAGKGSDYLTASVPLSHFGVTTAPTINSIYFVTRGGSTNGSNFSNVTLTQGPAQVVPEPAAFGLLGVAGAALLLLRRRRTV